MLFENYVNFNTINSVVEYLKKNACIVDNVNIITNVDDYALLELIDKIGNKKYLKIIGK